MQNLKEKINLGISLLLCTSAILVYTLVFSQLNKGTSIDEGFYLLSYLKNQPLGNQISQFAYIVQTTFGFLPEDNALSLRYVGLAITLLSLLCFALASYSWLLKRQVAFSRLTYFSLIFLAGALNFSFASPVLYYDNIQSCIYLLVFSILFLLENKTITVKFFLHIVAGILFILGLFIYLPSGILLILLYLAFVTFYSDLSKKEIILNFIFILTGLLMGTLVYHLFIHDITHTISSIYNAFISAQKGVSSHDNSSLIIAALTYFAEVFLIFIIFFVVSFLFCFSMGKVKIKAIKIILFMIGGFLFCLLLLYRRSFTTYYTDLLLLPIAFIIASYVVNAIIEKKAIQVRLRDVLLILLFLFTSFAGVFGTNQVICAKMMFFMPFWIVAYVLMIGNRDDSMRLKNISIMLWLGLLFAAYVHLSYFTRRHYYHTPVSSKMALTNTERFKGIKVSQWQKEYYENAVKQLREHGYTNGKDILTFYEDFMTVYMIGGYIPEKLVYQSEVFMSDPQNLPHERVDYIIIIQEQEQAMAEYLKNSGWEFPEKYERIDLGRSAKNLPENTYNSILFIYKD